MGAVLIFLDGKIKPGSC